MYAVEQDLNGIANINPYRYSSYYYDAETGMYYLQSRYYNPNVGRFVNGDEVIYTFISKNASGYNTFAYCNNNAVNWDDKTGHYTGVEEVIGICVGAVVAAAIILFLMWFISFVSSGNFRKEWSKYHATQSSALLMYAALLVYAGASIKKS